MSAPGEALERLSVALSRLPGIGRRSAERMAMHMAVGDRAVLDELSGALDYVRQQVCGCRQCGVPTLQAENPCTLCTDPRRDDHVVCVVEDPSDILMIERAGGFRGRYHALMGTLSPPRGRGAEDLRARALVQRVRGSAIREVILALSTDVEGDATSAFVTEALKHESVTITRLAFGLPAGSGVRYADAVTLDRAFKGRQSA